MFWSGCSTEVGQNIIAPAEIGDANARMSCVRESYRESHRDRIEDVKTTASLVRAVFEKSWWVLARGSNGIGALEPPPWPQFSVIRCTAEGAIVCDPVRASVADDRCVGLDCLYTRPFGI